jgi:hypothetical protein
VGGELAADDRVHVRTAVGAVVDDAEAAGDPPAAGAVRTRGVQRAHAPPDALAGRLGDPRQQRIGLAADALALPVGPLEPLGAVDGDARRAEDHLGAVGDDDVAVGGGATPVEHPLEAAVGDGDHHAAGGAHPQLDARQCGELWGPRPGGVDDVVGGDPRVEVAADVDSGDAVPVGRDRLDGRVGVDRRAVCLRVEGGRGDEPRGPDDAVGDGERAGDVVGGATDRRGDRLRSHRRGVDPHRPARGEAGVVVGGVVVDELDEHAAGGRDAVAGDPGEDARLRPAAGRIVGVRAGVARAAVEHAVGAPGGAPAEAAPLEEGDVDAPGGEVARGAHAGGAPADDEDRGVVGDARDAARGR